MRRHAATLSILAAVTALAAGCATARTDSPAASDDMVIEVSTGGGLAPPVVRVADTLPRIWIGGDGRYLRQSATAETTALDTVEERRLPDSAVQSLLDEAGDAGLLADAPDFGTPKIFDAANTRVVVVADGTRHDVLIRALGYPVPDLDAATAATRKRVSEFIDALEHPERIAGAGAPQRYVPAAVAVYVLGPSTSPATEPTGTWPLGDLAAAGTPTQWPTQSARCFVVTGADVTTLETAAAGVPRFAPWRAGNVMWDLALRPLLPDEHTCADVTG